MTKSPAGIRVMPGGASVAPVTVEDAVEEGAVAGASFVRAGAPADVVEEGMTARAAVLALADAEVRSTASPRAHEVTHRRPNPSAALMRPR
jgi:hypothetical protein